MLEIRKLSAGYPGNPVLHNISAAFPSGQITAILGPNGCGKSTLLKALCGAIPAQGELLLGGEALSGLSSRERAQKIAYLPQSRQVPALTVGRLVLHGRFPYLSYPRHYREEDRRMAENAMAQLGILPLKNRALATLSGGQRQKAYIAMALAQDTRVILLDEPTAYLDISHQIQTMTLARELAARGKTVVLVLHDIPMALERCDQILLLRDGQVVDAGTPEAVYARGKIDTVFGITLRRFPTEEGWRYYCE